jgi:hypothetical protein
MLYVVEMYKAEPEACISTYKCKMHLLSQL